MNRFVKFYLIFVTVLLLTACGAGLYVWYTLQNINTQLHDVNARVPLEGKSAPADAGKTSPETTSTESKTGTPTSDTTQSANTPAPKVYKVTELTESQQAILKTFGYTNETFTVTDTMIACAEKAVGNERLGEILGGSAPSPLESMKLLPCFKS